MLYGLQMDIVTDHLNKNDKKNGELFRLILEVQTQSKLVGVINLTLTRTAPCTVGINIHWAHHKIYSGPMLAIFVLKMFDWELGQ